MIVGLLAQASGLSIMVRILCLENHELVDVDREQLSWEGGCGGCYSRAMQGAGGDETAASRTCCCDGPCEGCFIRMLALASTLPRWRAGGSGDGAAAGGSDANTVF